MGLYNVCNIVQKHNEKIEVNSEEGKETAFMIILPVKLD